MWLVCSCCVFISWKKPRKYDAFIVTYGIFFSSFTERNISLNCISLAKNRTETEVKMQNSKANRAQLDVKDNSEWGMMSWECSPHSYSSYPSSPPLLAMKFLIMRQILQLIFLEKCIDAFIIVSYDAKPLFSDQRHLMKFIIFFYIEEFNIHNDIHREIIQLACSLLFRNT
jgi:hypothetical protein